MESHPRRHLLYDAAETQNVSVSCTEAALLYSATTI